MSTSRVRRFPNVRAIGLALLSVAAIAMTADAQDRRGRANRSVAGSTAGQARIAWYGSLERAKAEAARSGRPILFLSAAPMCQGVPGIW